MSSNKKPSYQHLDYGYSWVVLIACSVLSFFQLGIVKVFGVFIPELIEQLQLSAFAVGLSCSIGLGLRALLGPLWAALTHHFTYRTLVISGGLICTTGLITASLSQSFVHLCFSMVLLSIGSGLPIIARIVAIRDFFDKKFGIANGMSFTGGAIGMTVLAPLIELFIVAYGWRGAMLLYGSVNLHVCVAGALLIQHERSIVPPTQKVSPPALEYQTENAVDIKNAKEAKNRTGQLVDFIKDFTSNFGFSVLLKHKILLAYLTAMMLHEIVIIGWVLFLVSYTISTGYTAQVASFLSALGGGGALIGRIVTGPFIDRGLISGQTAFCLFLVGGAFMMFCYPFVTTYWILAVISLFAGLFLGSTSPVIVVLLKQILASDEKSFTGSMGQQYMWRSFGMLAGGPLTGWLYDISGNFYFSFMTLGALELVGAFLVMIRPNCHTSCLQEGTSKSHRQLEENIDGQTIGLQTRFEDDVGTQTDFAKSEGGDVTEEAQIEYEL